MRLGRISDPAGIRRVNELISFNVVKDGLANPVPPLLPINLQTFLGFNMFVTSELSNTPQCPTDLPEFLR